MATNPTSPVSAAPKRAATTEEKLVLTSSRYFPDWLARVLASPAFTTYQAGKLFLIAALPSVRNPAASGFVSDEIQA